ncbi:MAG: glycerophosphodiester phosphodiesterase [Dehalococcoidia bacterium]
MLNIAHRGFTKRFPGNTLEAFQAAIDLEVDGIECDVQETADNEFVIYHDPQLLGTEIGRLSLEQVRRARLEGNYRVPTLEETMEFCKDRTRVMLDLHSVRSLGKFLELVRRGFKPEELAMSAFDPELIRRLAELAPELRRGIIVDMPMGDPIEMLRSSRCQGIGVRFPSATKELVERIHENGFMILVWGCRDHEETREALQLDIDGIVSDFPDVVREELGRRKDK